MFEVATGSLIKDQFPAFEDDGVTKRSGLVYPADFSVTVYRDCVVQVAYPFSIAEIGLLGEYCLQYTPSTDGYWYFEIHILFSDDIYRSESVAGITGFAALIADMKRVLGLLHMNAILDKQTYDGVTQLLTARLRVFNTAANVPIVPGGNEVAGLLHEYIISSNGTDQPTRYSLLKVL